MTFSTTADLLLGDLELTREDLAQKYVDQAFDEMRAKLGWVYALPLRPAEPSNFAATEDSWQQLPDHEKLLLKDINNKIASGRYIMAQDVGGEDTTLHAYGYALLREGQSDLMALANGVVNLTAKRYVIEEEVLASARTPSIINEDEESLLLGFENSVMRGVPWWSRPGKVT